MKKESVFFNLSPLLGSFFTQHHKTGTDGTFYSQHPLKDWTNILSNGIQVNKSNVQNADYISNTNEWFYAYIQVGDELIPFEVMEDYRQTFKAVIASFCTLPWKRKKAG